MAASEDSMEQMVTMEPSEDGQRSSDLKEMKMVSSRDGNTNSEVEAKMVASHVNGEIDHHFPVRDTNKVESGPCSPASHLHDGSVDSGTEHSENVDLITTRPSASRPDGDVKPAAAIPVQSPQSDGDCGEHLCFSVVTLPKVSDKADEAVRSIPDCDCALENLNYGGERALSGTDNLEKVLPEDGAVGVVCSLEGDSCKAEVDGDGDKTPAAADDARIFLHEESALSEKSKDCRTESEKENIPVADPMETDEVTMEKISEISKEEGKQDDEKKSVVGDCVPDSENLVSAEPVNTVSKEGKSVAELPETDDMIKTGEILKLGPTGESGARTDELSSERLFLDSGTQQSFGTSSPESSLAKSAVKAKATARKSGQPVRQALIFHKEGRTSEPGTIKITNLHPSAKITLKLSELEDMLKVKDKCIRPAAGGENLKKDRGSDTTVNRVDAAESGFARCQAESSELASSQHAPEVKLKRKLRVKLRKKRRRGGTYDFPGKKPQKKKKLSEKEDGDESHFSSGDRPLLHDPLRHVNRKPIGSPRKPYSVLELLAKNSHRAFIKRRNPFMRRKSRESPLKGKSIVDMLQEKQRTLGDSGSETTSGVQDKQQPVNVAGNTPLSPLPTGENQDIELLERQRKRRISAEGIQSSPAHDDDSSGKRQKMADGTSTPPPPVLQPVVMVVTKHVQNTPGLRSILPKLNSVSTTPPPSTISSPATSVVVPAGQPILFVPTGSKLSLVPATLPSGTKSGLPLITTLAPVTSVDGLTKGMPSVATLLNFQPKSGHQASKSSNALRALLTKSGSPGQVKTVSVVSSPLPTARVASVPNSSLMSSLTTSAAFDKTHSFSKLSQSPMPKAKPLSSLSSSASSSSSLSDSVMSGEPKAPGSLPNGLSLPVTPPKTPEGESSVDGAAVSLTTPDNDVIPLCCCKIVGANFSRLSTGATYCQALDSVDGKVLGCCNKVTNTQLVRPGVKIPFMAVCEVHRKRLKLHQCCPGCGHFCTQGKFLQCRREGGSSVHNFHKQCQTVRDGRLFCPHCGEESGQMEVNLTLHEPRPSQSTEQIRANLRKTILKAKMSFAVPKKLAGDQQLGMTITLASSKTISTDGLPPGSDRTYLEKLIRLCSAKEDRPKKYRVLPKNMYQPAYEGDLDKVFYMLMDGMDPNQRCEEQEGQTVLHAAVYSGNLALVYLLIHSGAALHTPDKMLKTPLMVAAECGYLSIMKVLVTAGARLDDRGEDNMTCLHYAAKAGHLDVIQFVLDLNTLDINTTDEGGWTPIMWATESQLVEVVRYLVSRGGDPNKKDNEENTGLHWAAYAGSVEITELFMDMGCELDTPNEHGDCPLHIAARQDHYEVVVVLLARGASVELRNNKDETPIGCCLDQNSQVCMALKVNRQLRSFASKLSRPERLLHRDISLGREKNPLPCVNAVDNESYPTDYLYVNHNVETQDLHINSIITSLQSCRCKDDCSSLYCVCARSSIKCWYDKFGHLIEDFNMMDPPHIFECNRACRCWVNCNNRVVQNGVTCRLQVFRTFGRGWGVRPLMDIPKGTFICEYIGELLSDFEADRREDDSYLFDLDNKDGDTYCIDARKYGNVARFINHRCEPNLIPVKVFIEHQDLRFPRICFFSSCDIKAYEELGFDYGEKFWIIKWKQFTCTCGSPKCKYSSETIQRTLAEYRARHEDEEVVQDT